MHSEIKTALVACFIFLFTFGVYLFTTVPSVTGDDSGELGGVGATLGTAHPPGYPLYSLFGKGAVTLVPWGNRLFRVNLVSAVFIAFSCAVLFLACVRYGGGTAAACALSLAFAFSGAVWSMANVTEVYGIAVAAAGLILLALSGEPSPKRFYLVLYLLGLGLAAHYTLGLLVPGIAWWTLMHRKRIAGNRPAATAARGALGAVAGASVVLFIFLRARQAPLFGWEDPATIERFWQVIARLRYGSFALAQGGPPDLSAAVIARKISFYGSSLASDFTWAGILLFVIGLYRNVRAGASGGTLILLLLAAGPGFLLLANADIGPSSAELLRRFFFLSSLFAVAVMARGAGSLPRPLPALSMMIPVFLLVQNFPSLNRRNEYLFHDHGRNILRSLPRNTLLFSDRADEMEFTLAYFLLAEGKRSDVTLVDCNAGVTRSIYGDDYYRIWGKPRLERRWTVERGLIAAAARPVYYATFDPRMVDIPRVQEGLVFRAENGGRERSRFPFSGVYALRLPEDATVLDARSLNLVQSYFSLMGSYSLSAGAVADAGRHFSGLAAYDRNGRWTHRIAFLYHQKGLLDHAETYYRRAVAAGAADASLYTNLGTVYEAKGNQDAARRMYEEALKLDPDNVQAHYNLAVVYWRQSRWDDVVREFERVVALSPSHREANAYLRMARQRRGK